MNVRDGYASAAFDVLATRIDGAHARTVGFTSAVFGEGVSTLALGTALSLATLQQEPVLLVDANWLQPSLTLDADLSLAAGLAEYLRAGAKGSYSPRPTSRSRLSFLPAGDHGGDHPPLRAAPSFLGAAMAEYGTIVVDLPPVLASEALVHPWAASLDRLFLVIHEAATPLSLVRRALSTFGPNAQPQVILNRSVRSAPAGRAKLRALAAR